jgi:hypothetical protein
VASLAGALTDTLGAEVWANTTSLLAKIKWASKRPKSAMKVLGKQRIHKQS